MNFLLIIVIVLIIYCLFFSEDKKCYKIENNVEDFSNNPSTYSPRPISNLPPAISQTDSGDEYLRTTFDNVLKESLIYFEPEEQLSMKNLSWDNIIKSEYRKTDKATDASLDDASTDTATDAASTERATTT